MRSAMAVLVVLAVGAGYWFGQRGGQPPNRWWRRPAARQLLYYRNPMGLPDTSPVPKKDPMGMDYLPVYAGEEPTGRRRRHPRQRRAHPEAGGQDGGGRTLGRWHARCGRPAASRSTSGASSPWRRSSKAGSSACMSMSPARRWRAASRCSRSTARNWCRRSANTRWRPRGRGLAPPIRRPPCGNWPRPAWRGCATGTFPRSS